MTSSCKGCLDSVPLHLPEAMEECQSLKWLWKPLQTAPRSLCCQLVCRRGQCRIFRFLLMEFYGMAVLHIWFSVLFSLVHACPGGGASLCSCASIIKHQFRSVPSHSLGARSPRLNCGSMEVPRAGLSQASISFLENVWFLDLWWEDFSSACCCVHLHGDSPLKVAVIRLVAPIPPWLLCGL